jgi:hypothetical protein
VATANLKPAPIESNPANRFLRVVSKVNARKTKKKTRKITLISQTRTRMILNKRRTIQRKMSRFDPSRKVLLHPLGNNHHLAQEDLLLLAIDADHHHRQEEDHHLDVVGTTRMTTMIVQERVEDGHRHHHPEVVVLPVPAAAVVPWSHTPNNSLEPSLEDWQPSASHYRTLLPFVTQLSLPSHPHGRPVPNSRPTFTVISRD